MEVVEVGCGQASMQRLSKDTTVFMMCDVQERFRDVIYKFNAVALGARRMARGAGVLGVPLIERSRRGRSRGCAHVHLYVRWCFSRCSDLLL